MVDPLKRLVQEGNDLGLARDLAPPDVVVYAIRVGEVAPAWRSPLLGVKWPQHGVRGGEVPSWRSALPDALGWVLDMG